MVDVQGDDVGAQTTNKNDFTQEDADQATKRNKKKGSKSVASLSQTSDRSMQRQRRKDARIVRAVLKASENQDYYGVLGIRNWNLFIPAQTLRWGEHAWTIIPRTCLRKTTAKDIRKAYRTRALEVHPDKNQDGQAQEAFLAVEQAASILSDESKRKAYDEEWQRQVSIRRRRQKELTIMILRTVIAKARLAYNTIHSVVGPFTIPLLILGVLVF